ncbi:MAG: CapA family protein [Acidimicrobiia bacterium]|nr:CapA family protein [Acidimicrobiia bacterium]
MSGDRPTTADRLPTARSARSDSVTLALTGDVMCGRGVDQILRHPGNPTIHERWAKSSLAYVELAERHSGPLPRAVDPTYIWGGRLPVPGAVTVVNLETAVTDRGSPWPGKAIQYRMNPANVETLTAAGIDVAVLANNHVLDWSQPGLEQTLEVLDGAGISSAGAGATEQQAWSAAVVAAATARIVVLAVGSTDSGIPDAWAALDDKPGVALVPDLSDRAVDRVVAAVDEQTQPGDLVVLSIHWGPNWGYDIPARRRRFAHQVIDRAGVHLVHGHSSHHPLGIEVHRGHLVLYGCGDLLTDYEGIAGHEHYRGELGGIYLATLESATGKLRRLEIAPTLVRRFRLTGPPPDDVNWLAGVLDHHGRRFGTGVDVGPSGRLIVTW